MAVYEFNWERFWSKVNKDAPGGCWLWTAGCFKRGGYGAFGHGRSMVRDHCVAMQDHIGRELKPGECVLHNCPNGDNPKCVNPAHLFLGSRGDNNRDMAKKGRAGKKTNAGAILKPDSVLAIVEMSKTHKRSAVMSKFKIDKSTLCAILVGRNWSAVTGIKRA